jgi:signal peptidase I
MNNSLGDAVPIPENCPRNKAPDRFVYRGPSMAPTFRPGQILHVCPQARDIAPGDVIVFHGQNGIGHVVHRVISVSPEGFITRGDNNLLTDPDPILPNQVVGRVGKANFGGQARSVVGGQRGLRLARMLRLMLQIKRLLRRVFRWPYHRLKHSGIVAMVWRPEIETIYFETQDGPLVKYVHKGRTVASCWLDSNRWWFRRPYDFVIGLKLKR